VKQLIYQVGTVIRKDLAVEMRSRERLIAMLVFALIVILVFSFAFDLRVQDAAAVAPGVLWVTFSFAGMLGLGRSFVREREDGCLDGLLLCPVDRSAIYVAKMVGNLLFIALMEACTLPIFFALFNLALPPLLLVVILLGTIGFAAVGTLFAAMMAYARARDLLLPVLFFPIVIPLLIAGVKLSAGLFDGQPWSEINHWLHFMIAFDVILLVVSYLSFEYLVEE